MDGVVTETATVHALAWKRTFDDYLRYRARERGEVFREFSPREDYRAYVDGRPRYQGVAAFLTSRSITLPPGEISDTAGSETVCGLGNRKNELFNAIISKSGVGVYRSTIGLIEELLRAGVLVGLATSSRNAELILQKTQTASLFGTVVDGVTSARLGLKGKPHPDIFLTASANLGSSPSRSIVIEDAVTGVQAGAAGGFALVLGVAREENKEELRENGADVVVDDLGEVSVEDINRLVRQHGGT